MLQGAQAIPSALQARARAQLLRVSVKTPATTFLAAPAALFKVLPRALGTLLVE